MIQPPKCWASTAATVPSRVIRGKVRKPAIRNRGMLPLQPYQHPQQQRQAGLLKHRFHEYFPRKV